MSNSRSAIIRETIHSGLREDSRDLFSFRSLRLLFNSKHDVAEVSLGGTKVYAKIEAIVTEPRIDRQNEGFIEFRVDLNALQSVASHRQIREKSAEMTKILERSIKGSR